MLDEMEGLPENVVAMSASGRVTGDDYDAVLMPAVKRALARHERIRFLYRLGSEFAGFATLWGDSTIALSDRRAAERIAVVTDSPWIADAVKEFGFLAPCPVKVFADSELALAKVWVTAGRETESRLTAPAAPISGRRVPGTSHPRAAGTRAGAPPACS